MGRPRLSVKDRILGYTSVDPEAGCWEWLAKRMTVHLLIETGRASRLAACDEPFANGRPGAEDLSEVTCTACLAMFPDRPRA